MVDAATRREALQRKVGAIPDESQFDKLNQQRKVGHVGLAESLVFLADGLGWTLDELNESVDACDCQEDRQDRISHRRQGRGRGHATNLRAAHAAAWKY